MPTDTPTQNKNLSLQTPGTMGGTPSLSGTPGATGGADPGLQGFLASNYDPYADTILGQYGASKAAAAASAGASAKAISDTGNYNLGYQSDIDKAEGTQALEKGRGFVVNPGQISLLQEQSTKRIKDLTTQMNDALASNNTSLASKLADLSLQENTALTEARTTFLSQYFQGKQEQRAEQSFQTPEQQAVFAMASANPGAGISSTDTLAQAQAKVQSSAPYKLGLSSTQSTIGLQGSQAELAAEQTRQTKIVNDFMGGNINQFKPDIDGLVGGSVTDQTLHAKYDGFPGGAGTAIIASIESAAQKQGWNPQAASLRASAQQSQNDALNSGNPFTLLGAGATQLFGATGSALGGKGSFLGSVFGSGNSLSSSPAAGTDGTSYGFPGYVSNGSAWVKK